MIYKRLMCSAFAAMLLFQLSAQLTIEKAFQSIPENVLWVDKPHRAELLAYFKDKKQDSISNNLNGYFRLVDFDETLNHLALNTSRKGNVELQILGPESAPLIGVIFTVCTPACNSNVQFYDANWQLADIKLPQISASDFLKEGLTEDELAQANRLMTPLFVGYAFKKGTNEMVLTCNMSGFLSDNDWQQLKSFLKTERLNLIFENGIWKYK